MDKETYNKWLLKEMREWFSVPENYSVVHFAIEHGMSKEELFRVCSEDGELQRVLDYVMSVQEYKVTEGAITGELDRNVALKMLETYSGWKGEVNILQRNEYKQFMNEARVKAEQILRGMGEEGVDGSEEGGGEVGGGLEEGGRFTEDGE